MDSQFIIKPKLCPPRKAVVNDPREALALIGFMDEPSARDFLTNDCILEKSPEEVTALIRLCRDAVLRHDPPDIEAKTIGLPPETDGLLSEIARDERLPKVVKGRKWSFREVEIDKLISIQRYIDTGYAEAISRKLDLGTIEGRVRFCLTDEFRIRESEVVDVPSALTFAIKGPGPDLRVMGSGASFDRRTGDRTVSFTIGWGYPFVQVAILGGRHVLKNGYHRAYALRKRGYEYLPCLLLGADTYTDLECAGPPTFFGEDSISGIRPPLFSSFFDTEIAPLVKMRSYAKAAVIRPNFTLLEPEALATYLNNEVALVPEPDDQQLEYIGVRVRHEDWNVYKLVDGTILKLRTVVMRVRRTKQNGEPGEPDLSNIMIVCNPPKGKKGHPLSRRPTPKEITDSITDPNVRFATVNEPVNEYLTDDGKRIILRLRLYNLAKTNQYDARGDPIYLPNAKPEVTTVDLPSRAP